MIITRFAPSPTGYLHIGGVRTALYNFLLARQNNGKFILRIEDTDKVRSKKEYEDDIIKSLDWLSLKWDEFYRQSDRRKIYSDYLSLLLKNKKAFYCSHTKNELEIERQEAKLKGKPQVHWCNQKTNCCLKSANAVIRLAVEQGRVIKFKDLVRGEIAINTNTLGDFVIAKSLNEPLYNFAAVVDDSEMSVTDVIRGEEHISNTPKQILILEALNKKAPNFAHLPLILGQDKAKLSKRHGAASLNEFKKKGYLPEALINFLALLGWHPSDNREHFSLSELIKEFSLNRIQKSSAIFDLKKLESLNSYYLKKLNFNDFFKLAIEYLKEDNSIDFKWIQDAGIDLNKILLLEKERIKRLCDIKNVTDIYLKRNLDYKPELLAWKNQDFKEIKMILNEIKEIIGKLDCFDKISIQKTLEDISVKYLDKGKVFWPFRVAISGKEKSASPTEIADALGKKETLRRIDIALDILNDKEG